MSIFTELSQWWHRHPELAFPIVFVAGIPIAILVTMVMDKIFLPKK